MAKYLAHTSGTLTETPGLASSAGAGDAGKLIETDGTGRVHNSMLPVGIGADTKAVTTSEALAAGDFVNLHSATGLKARKADGSSSGKRAHGFVLSAVTSGASATVYFEGANTQLSGLTAGLDVYLSASTPGQATATPPSGTGQIVQILGVATDTTEVNFEPQQPIVLA